MPRSRNTPPTTAHYNLQKEDDGLRSETEMPGADSISDGEMEQLENQVHDYILDNGGALVLSKAANELGIPVDLVRESVERMTSDGRLKQTGESVATQSG